MLEYFKANIMMFILVHFLVVFNLLGTKNVLRENMSYNYVSVVSMYIKKKIIPKEFFPFQLLLVQFEKLFDFLWTLLLSFLTLLFIVFKRNCDD